MSPGNKAISIRPRHAVLVAGRDRVRLHYVRHGSPDGLRGAAEAVLYHPLPANVGADGWTEDLVPLPDPPEPRTLTRLIGTRVQTIRGPGVLWDHKGTEARVVLDASPKVWTPLDIGELLLSQGAA